MKYYLHDLECATVSEIKLNDIVNTITFYIKINFLAFGIYRAVKTANKEYQIVSKWDNQVIYIINTKQGV